MYPATVPAPSSGPTQRSDRLGPVHSGHRSGGGLAGGCAFISVLDALRQLPARAQSHTLTVQRHLFEPRPQCSEKQKLRSIPLAQGGLRPGATVPAWLWIRLL